MAVPDLAILHVAAKCAHRALPGGHTRPHLVRDVTRAASPYEGFDWQRLIINKVSPGIFKRMC